MWGFTITKQRNGGMYVGSGGDESDAHIPYRGARTEEVPFPGATRRETRSTAFGTTQ